MFFFLLSLLLCVNTQSIDYIRAVSLGGHLVPEPFIVPDVWETLTRYCPGAKDIWNLCECTSQNQWSSSQVVPIMQAHLTSFIDLNDLGNKIVGTHINALRYPISFTYFLDQNQDPTEYTKYASCGLTGLAQTSFVGVLQLAQKHGVRVILDLHQVQGCQNGFDNGGHAGVKEFFTSDNIQKGINIWKNLVSYLQRNGLLSLIWGFEILNEPLPDDSSMQLLQTFTETVVNQVIAPIISSNQVIVLQPGPGNALVSAYQNYNLNSNLRYVFDFHEYIVFGSLSLTTMGDVLGVVDSIVSNGNGATKWPYFVGEWSLATTDCAQYLNGAFGGYDPDYYQKQHQSRSSFYCNQVNQIRNGFTVGFQTCSVILTNNDSPSYGYCTELGYDSVFQQYRGAMCKLFTTYLLGFKKNPNNVGFAFWTFTTGVGERRIQQWDYSWAVNNKMINDTINPTPLSQCDNML